MDGVAPFSRSPSCLAYRASVDDADGSSDPYLYPVKMKTNMKVGLNVAIGIHGPTEVNEETRNYDNPGPPLIKSESHDGGVVDDGC
ncbi:hypothetical protein MLD38_006763 [Melastoma candidum]|uniref:Uncharacterized protein n=1 Tax=Melastoma candidum TaxID=119954 RepID=A0ACB9RQ86_9MYRT|nr:hypothetical protein MLD38_006763 [Melastoma candidum]